MKKFIGTGLALLLACVSHQAWANKNLTTLSDAESVILLKRLTYAKAANKDAVVAENAAQLLGLNYNQFTTPIYKGKVAPLRKRHNGETSLSADYYGKKHINFAGTLIHWYSGCGTFCVIDYMTDVRTGKTYEIDSSSIYNRDGRQTTSDDQCPSRLLDIGIRDGSIYYKANSKLFIYSACGREYDEEEKDHSGLITKHATITAYVWDEKKNNFKKIKSRTITAREPLEY